MREGPVLPALRHLVRRTVRSETDAAPPFFPSSPTPLVAITFAPRRTCFEKCAKAQYCPLFVTLCVALSDRKRTQRRPSFRRRQRRWSQSPSRRVAHVLKNARRPSTARSSSPCASHCQIGNGRSAALLSVVANAVGRNHLRAASHMF